MRYPLSADRGRALVPGRKADRTEEHRREGGDDADDQVGLTIELVFDPVELAVHPIELRGHLLAEELDFGAGTLDRCVQGVACFIYLTLNLDS